MQRANSRTDKPKRQAETGGQLGTITKLLSQPIQRLPRETVADPKTKPPALGIA